jgi:hypothetical protein
MHQMGDALVTELRFITHGGRIFGEAWQMTILTK